MKIIDLSAGNRAVWFDKNYRDATYLDCRESANPDVICDSRKTPFKDGEFDLVVFDPPHVNFGANAQMSKTYGHHTTSEIRDIVSGTSKEAYRITRTDALMALKWNDHDQKLDKILCLMSEWEPLFGHKTSIRTKHLSTTYWVMLRRMN